jgi:membrane protease YdiL (CAAX protease family)
MSALIFTFRKINPLFFLVSIFAFSLLGPIIASQFPTPPGTDPSHISRLTTFNLYLISLFLSPTIETIMFQYFPFIIAKRFSGSESWAFLAITLPFSMAHFIPSAPFPSLINGFVGGVSLGVCYLTYIRNSHSYAFFMTSLIHSAHNAAVLIFI